MVEHPKVEPTSVVFPDYIKDYNITATWSMFDEQTQDKKRPNFMISDSMMTELEKLTQCKLVQKLEAGIIYVGAHSAEDRQRVTRKLDNIRELSVSLERFLRNQN